MKVCFILITSGLPWVSLTGTVPSSWTTTEAQRGTPGPHALGEAALSLSSITSFFGVGPLQSSSLSHKDSYATVCRPMSFFLYRSPIMIASITTTRLLPAMHHHICRSFCLSQLFMKNSQNVNFLAYLERIHCHLKI